MKRRKKHLFCLACAVLMCFGIMTGCGKEQKKEVQQPLTGYEYKKRVRQINGWAKNVYNAAVAAMIDMDSEDTDLTQLSEYMFYTGSEFADCEYSSDDIDEKLRSRIYAYYNDITKLQEVAIRLDQDDVPCGVAVKRTYQRTGQVFYGTWPTQADDDSEEQFFSIEEALEFACGNTQEESG